LVKNKVATATKFNESRRVFTSSRTLARLSVSGSRPQCFAEILDRPEPRRDPVRPRRPHTRRTQHPTAAKPAGRRLTRMNFRCTPSGFTSDKL
jgi:hypothetical protein